MATKPALQNILKSKYTQKMKINATRKMGKNQSNQMSRKSNEN
jgi:hypothetical protein